MITIDNLWDDFNNTLHKTPLGKRNSRWFKWNASPFSKRRYDQNSENIQRQNLKILLPTTNGWKYFRSSWRTNEEMDGKSISRSCEPTISNTGWILGEREKWENQGTPRWEMLKQNWKQRDTDGEIYSQIGTKTQPDGGMVLVAYAPHGYHRLKPVGKNHRPIQPNLAQSNLR